MRVFLLAAISLLTACSSLSQLSSDKDDPEIAFGLMKGCGKGRYCVYAETTTIPLHLSDPGFRFGASVEHRKAGDHVGHIVLHFPAEPGQVVMTFGNEYEPLEHSLRNSGRTMETAQVSYEKYWGVDFSLDEKDPLGQYILEVYIDGEMKQSIPFEVVSCGD